MLFFGFHQAAVRFMAVDPNDPNLGVILGVLQAGLQPWVQGRVPKGSMDSVP